MVQKNLKEWDLKLPHVEFAYDKTPAKATGCSPFEALYGINPFTHIVHCLLIAKSALRMKKEPRR